MNSDLGKYLLTILFLNVMFFSVQLAIAKTDITSMNGSDTISNQVRFFDYNGNGSMLKDFDCSSSGHNYSLCEDINGEIPSGTSTIDANTDNFFTDTWKTLRSWILAVPGANTIYNIVNALPHFLTAMGVDYEIVFALGFLWHALTIFLIISWIKGG